MPPAPKDSIPVLKIPSPSKGEQKELTLKKFKHLFEKTLTGSSISYASHSKGSVEKQDEKHASVPVHIQHGGSLQAKSIAIYDPPELKDGENPKFLDWRYLMEMKINPNADHFDSPLARLSYVLSRTTGQAQKDLISRMRNRVLSPITDAEDAFKYLAMIYNLRDTKLLTKFQRACLNPDLLMSFECAVDEFTNFEDDIQQFIRLSVESESPEAGWKKDLLSLVIGEAFRADLKMSKSWETGTFEEFARECCQHIWRAEYREE